MNSMPVSLLRSRSVLAASVLAALAAASGCAKPHTHLQIATHSGDFTAPGYSGPPLHLILDRSREGEPPQHISYFINTLGQPGARVAYSNDVPVAEISAGYVVATGRRPIIVSNQVKAVASGSSLALITPFLNTKSAGDESTLLVFSPDVGHPEYTAEFIELDGDGKPTGKRMTIKSGFQATYNHKTGVFSGPEPNVIPVGAPPPPGEGVQTFDDARRDAVRTIFRVLPTLKPRPIVRPRLDSDASTPPPVAPAAPPSPPVERPPGDDRAPADAPPPPAPD